MQNLLKLIRRFHFFLIFLLLEVLAFFLIIRKNNYLKVSFLNSSNQVTGSAYSVYGNVREYFFLRQQNELLLRENAQLRQQVISSYKKVFAHKTLTNDTTLEQAFSFIPAKVVNNSVTSANNYFTIDVGKRYGVKDGMGVISPQGIAGVVKGTSENFAVCISVLNTNIQKYSVRLKKSGEIGNLEWDGENPHYGTVRNLPTNVELTPGDTIETSGFSSIFPEEIMVGVVESSSINPNDGFYQVKTRFSTDFFRLRSVYVVDYKYAPELLILQDSLMNE